MLRTFYSFSLVLCSLTVSAQATDRSDIRMIQSQRMASNAAIDRHDVAGIACYWLDDFVQVRGNGTSIKGKDSITASWIMLFKTQPTVKYIRNPTAIIVNPNKQMAWETGEWIGINSYSNGGNYSAMWRKMDGKWKLQAELYVALK